jgi:hypothetical protein
LAYITRHVIGCHLALNMMVQSALDDVAAISTRPSYVEQGKEWGPGTYSVTAVVQHAISPLFEGDKQRPVNVAGRTVGAYTR